MNAGPTVEMQGNHRTASGSTWVSAPGCNAWQVEGNRFNERVVINITAAH